MPPVLEIVKILTYYSSINLESVRMRFPKWLVLTCSARFRLRSSNGTYGIPLMMELERITYVEGKPK